MSDNNEKPNQKPEVYVVLNPVAGHSSAGEIRTALEESFNQSSWSYEIYETTGKENVPELVNEACKKGADLIVAAGGDGTVAGAVNGLIGNDATLGIIPVGTGNGLARALGIPLDVPGAIKLLAESTLTQPIDAMKVGDKYYILNVSAGISARAMRRTPAETKRRFGMLAYARTIISEALGFTPRRFNIVVDNHKVQVRATEILASNGRPLKEPPFPLGPRERLNDGIFDIYIISATTIRDYLKTIWALLRNPKDRKSDLCTLTMRRKLHIEAVGREQPVQADGEVIGFTPIDIEMVHSALKVIVPPLEDEQAGEVKSSELTRA